jgi:hypothetical protein
MQVKLDGVATEFQRISLSSKRPFQVFLPDKT